MFLTFFKNCFSALYFTTPLNFLKKFLIDDINNIQQLLPDFYLSGCYKNFFALVTDCFKSNITKGYSIFKNFLNYIFQRNLPQLFIHGSTLLKNSRRQIWQLSEMVRNNNRRSNG